MEAKLDEILKEFRKGHREGSVISVQTVDSLSTADKEVWRSIRKEFEDMGLSLAAFEANKAFIFSWLEKAIANGALEEQAEETDEAGSGSESVFSESASTRSASPDQATSGGQSMDTKPSPSPVQKFRSVLGLRSSPHPETFHFSRPMHSSKSSFQRKESVERRGTQTRTSLEQYDELGEGDSQKSSARASQAGQGNSSAKSTPGDDGVEPSPSSIPSSIEDDQDLFSTSKAHYPWQPLRSHVEEFFSAITNGLPEVALELLRSQSSAEYWVSDPKIIYRVLVLAVKSGFAELLEPLLVAGQVQINDRDFLKEAINRGWVAKVKIVTLQRLLDLGADPSRFGSSCVLRAIDCNDEDALRVLLDTGIDVNARMGPKNDTLPLHHAVHRADSLYEYKTLVRMILDHGADVNRTDPAGHTPLGLAVAKRRHYYVDFLISHGADLEKPTRFSSIAQPVALVAPLVGALTRNEFSIAELLIRKGADISKHHASLSVLDVFSGVCGSLPGYPRMLRLLDRAPACAVHAAIVRGLSATTTLMTLLRDGAHTDWDIVLILAFINHRWRFYRRRHLRVAQMLENSQGALVMVLEKCSEARGNPLESRFLNLQVSDVMAACIVNINTKEISADVAYMRSLVDEVLSRCSKIPVLDWLAGSRKDLDASSLPFIEA